MILEMVSSCFLEIFPHICFFFFVVLLVCVFWGRPGMVVTHFAPAPITQLIFVLEVTNLYTNYPFFPYKCQPFKALQEYHRPCVLMLNTWRSFVITYSTIRVGCNTCSGEVSVDTRECASKKVMYWNKRTVFVSISLWLTISQIHPGMCGCVH